MPNHYPSISTLISLNDIPDTFGLVQNLNSIFSKIHYKDLQVAHSTSGDAGYYDMKLVLNDELGIAVPGVPGMKILLNPGYANLGFNVSYQLPILKYLKDFDLVTFAADAKSYYELLLNIAGATEQTLLSSCIYGLVNDPDPIQKFIDTYNQKYGLSPGLTLSGSNEEEILNNLITQLTTIGENVFEMVFRDFVGLGININDAFEKFSQLFYNLMGNFSLEDIKNLMRPSFSAGLELPGIEVTLPEWLCKPVLTTVPQSKLTITTTGGNYRAVFDTNSGFELIEGGTPTISLTDSYIIPFKKSDGTTDGFRITGLKNAKLDLSRKKNIPEAIADGRPEDFIGIYIPQVSIGLPSFLGGGTASIEGKNLLMGTGGISGTLGLKNGVTGFKFDIGSLKINIKKFDVTLKQNSIVGSSISGTLTIPGFKKGSSPAEIDIECTLGDGSDFSITAPNFGQLLPEFTCFDVFKVKIKSLSIGKRDGKYYISTACILDFLAISSVPAIGDKLPKNIDIKKLVIWDDGSIEFEGGGITMPQVFKMDIGPVKMSVSNLCFGSDEKYHNGTLRKYNYFGFDGTISVNPGGVDARGDGIKFYFTTDNSGTAKPDHKFLRIEGFGVEIRIPGDAESDEDVDVLIKGYLSMKDAPAPSNPKEGNPSTEYTGSVSFSIKKVGISGSADMRMNPDTPAFIIDAGLELASPIPLGATGLGIYGFRGLIGDHYRVSKTAAGVSEEDKWWAYYKAKTPPKGSEGINVYKFANEPGFNIGAGISLATQADSGRSFSSKIFIMLGLPDVFMLQGQAAILKERVRLDSSVDPPFSAFLVISSSSVEAGLGVNYQIPDSGSSKGSVLDIQAKVEMAFYFNNASGWYINFGKDSPESERMQARILSLFNGYAYLMLSAKGIKAGAGASWKFNRSYGPVGIGVGAYLNKGGYMSFKPVQMGGFIDFGGYAFVKAFGFKFNLSIGAMLAVDAFAPFVIKGMFTVSVGLPWPFDDIDIDVELVWIFNEHKDNAPISVMDTTGADLPKGYKPAMAINMHSNENFNVKVFNGAPTSLTLTEEQWNDWIIPMDSFIDIDLAKSVRMALNNSSNIKIGGNLYPPKFAESVPPVRGQSMPVSHQFEINQINILALVDTANNIWKDYNVYEAIPMLADMPTITVTDLDRFKELPNAYWQLTEPGKNTKLRVMSQDILSWTKQASPGSVNLEYFGIKGSEIFCTQVLKTTTCLNWEASSLLNGSYAANTAHKGDNMVQLRFRNHVGKVVSTTMGAFKQAIQSQSKDGKGMEVYFNTPCPQVDFKLSVNSLNINSSDPATLIIEYYKLVVKPTNDNSIKPTDYELIKTETSNVYDDGTHGHDQFSIAYSDGANPLSKLVILCKHEKTLLGAPDNSAKIAIGRRLVSSYGTCSFQGVIDDVRLYEGLIPPSDVNNWYNSNTAPTGSGYTLNGHWNMEGNPDDSIVSQPGTISNPPPLQVPGKVGSLAYRFQNDNHYIHVDNHPNFTFNGVSFSMFTWVKTSINTNWIQVIYDKRNWTAFGLFGYVIFTYDGYLSVQVANVRWTNYAYKGKRISDGNWHHVGFTVDYPNGKLTMYLDGVPVLTDVPTPQFAPVKKIDYQAVNLHQVCYLNQEDYSYNISIPDSSNMLKEVKDMSDGLKKTIQPVWRPNTRFAIYIKGTDTVDGVPKEQHYTIAFRTKGPLGLFHKYKNHAGSLVYRPAYQTLLTNDRADAFKLATLKHYIDFKRSYPNPDGNLLMAKPMFYGAPQMRLFFNEPYMKMMYGIWNTYNLLPAVNCALTMKVKDPISGEELGTPVWSVTDFRQSEPNVNILNNLVANGINCNGPDMTTIQRKGYTLAYTLPNLKPSKLYSTSYTAVMNSEQEKVHHFTFLTSRYINMEAQVKSFILATGTQTAEARYFVKENFDAGDITLLQNILTNPNAIDDEVRKNYAHPFDRLLDKSLKKIRNLGVPQFTEVNIILNNTTIIGVLVRNPEPFFDPRLPDATLAASLEIKNVHAGTTYSTFNVLYSKDRSQIFISNAGLALQSGTMTLKFRHSFYNGESYNFDNVAANNPQLTFSLTH
jgi:hypothetical protein